MALTFITPAQFDQRLEVMLAADVEPHSAARVALLANLLIGAGIWPATSLAATPAFRALRLP